MKTTSLIVAAWCLHGPISALAGPAVIVEHFLGSSPDAYAIMRVEVEKSADGGTTRTKTWLHEYSKKTPPGKTSQERRSQPENYGNPEINGAWYTPSGKLVIRSTLVTDISQTARLGPEKNEPLATTVHSKSEGPLIPDLMARYPTRILTPWEAEMAGRLHCDCYHRTICCGELVVVADLTDRLFGGEKPVYDGQTPSREFAIDAIAGDDNATYVTVSRTDGAVKSIAVLCVPPELSNHLRARASAETHYLCAGTFKSRDEALECARKMREKADGNPLFQGFEVATWSGYDMNYCFTIYSVVISRSMEIVGRREVGEFEEMLGKPLTLRTSKRFQVKVTDPGPAR